MKVSSFCTSVLLCSCSTDETMKRIAKQICDECQEQALRLQEERARRPGRGSQFLWYVTAAISLVETRYNPKESEAFKRQAVDRVAKSLYKVLSLYDQPTEESLATEVSCALTPRDVHMLTKLGSPCNHVQYNYVCQYTPANIHRVSYSRLLHRCRTAPRCF
jgi:hypothetical protein